MKLSTVTLVAMAVVCRKYAIIKEMYDVDIFPTVGLLLEEKSVGEIFSNKRRGKIFSCLR